MHLQFLGEYWWAVLVAMVVAMLAFIFITGRGAEGGLGGQARQGWSKWRALSNKAGELLARIILTIFYFTLAAPFGLMLSLAADPLRLKKSSQSSGWLTRQTRDRTLDDARRQF